MKGEKRSPKRRSLFFNAADMQLASQLCLLTRLSLSKWQQPNTPHFKDYTADDVANSRTNSSVCLAGQGQGRAARQGAGQGPSVLLSCRAGRAGQGPNKE